MEEKLKSVEKIVIYYADKLGDIGTIRKNTQQIHRWVIRLLGLLLFNLLLFFRHRGIPVIEDLGGQDQVHK